MLTLAAAVSASLFAQVGRWQVVRLDAGYCEARVGTSGSTDMLWIAELSARNDILSIYSRSVKRPVDSKVRMLASFEKSTEKSGWVDFVVREQEGKRVLSTKIDDAGKPALARNAYVLFDDQRGLRFKFSLSGYREARAALDRCAKGGV